MNTTPPPPAAGAPLGIWPCDPAPGEDDRLPELVEHLTPTLLRRVLAEYARPGDPIGLAAIDPSTTRRDDSRFAAVPAEAHAAPTTPTPHAGAAHGAAVAEQPGSFALIVAAIPRPGADDTGIYRTWRRQLRDGGVLVALTVCPAGAVAFANNAGRIVAAATAGGLRYQQHIVAIHARILNDRLLTPPTHGPAESAAPGPAVQHPVHSDLLVFTTDPTDAAGDATGGAR